MKLKITGSILLLSILITAGAFGQSMRVGFMDPDAILEQLPEREQIEQQLDNYIQEREQEFQDEAIEYQNLMGQLQEGGENMSDRERQRLQRQLQQMEQELQQLQQRIERDFERRRNELMQPIYNEMNTHIQELAEEKDLDYVLNETTGRGEMILIHVSDEGRANLDLTDQVLQRMLNN